MALNNFHIGEMRSKARFEKNTPTDLGAGKKDSFSAFLTVRGRLRKTSGFRTLEASESVLNSRYEFICRFRSDLDSEVGEYLRVFIDDRFFVVDSFERVDQRKHLYRFILNEQQKNG